MCLNQDSWQPTSHSGTSADWKLLACFVLRVPPPCVLHVLRMPRAATTRVHRAPCATFMCAPRAPHAPRDFTSHLITATHICQVCSSPLHVKSSRHSASPVACVMIRLLLTSLTSAHRPHPYTAVSRFPAHHRRSALGADLHACSVHAHIVSAPLPPRHCCATSSPDVAPRPLTGLSGTATVRAHLFVLAVGRVAGMARPRSTRVESGH